MISNLHAGRKTKQLGVGSAKRMNYRKIKNEYSRHILNQVVFLHISLNSNFEFVLKVSPFIYESKYEEFGFFFDIYNHHFSSSYLKNCCP